MDNHSLTNYEQACRYLDALQMHKIKLGLEAMRATLADLGSPELCCPAVHVAGTNGKGSVCSMLRTMLSGAGYRTGLYTSPHLSSVRERFRIDDRYISEEEFTRLLERVRRSLGTRKITYFECTTALAFCWFAEQACDIVILETGMGGRLDATNVITPLVAVITTVSRDHEQYLGTTIEQIAYEKAGIVKPGVPVISGVTDAPACSVIEQACRRHRAPLVVFDSDFTAESEDPSTWRWQDRFGTVITGLPATQGGDWQRANSACAVAAAVALRKGSYNLSDETIRVGLQRSFWPGRMEYLERTVSQKAGGAGAVTRKFLLDGAHNEAGVRSLKAALRQFAGQRRLAMVWASMADKDYQPMLRDIVGSVDVIILTRPDSERAAHPEDLAAALGDVGCTQIIISKTVAEALAAAIALTGPDDLIVAAGSLYLIGEFRRLLVGEVVDHD